MLNISDVRLWIKIGCSDEERALPSCISFDIQLHLRDIPALQSDKLEDTICYAEVVSKISQFCQERSFNLIEFLAAQVHEMIKNLVNLPANKIIVKATKLSSPIANIVGGVSFVYHG